MSTTAHEEQFTAHPDDLAKQPTPQDNTSNPAPGHVLKAVEAQWIGRANALRYKPTTKEYRQAEVEYFVGAMAVLTAQGYTMPVVWTINIMSGRPVVDLSKET